MSKAYKLLPHFTTKEEEDLLSNEDDYVEYDEDGNPITKKKEKVEEIQSESFTLSGPKFITQDLLHLNDPPPYPYLPVTDPLLKKQKIYKRPTT